MEIPVYRDFSLPQPTCVFVAGEIGFDWDDDNADHVARHGFAPEQIEMVLRNDPIDWNYDDSHGEPRWSVIGHLADLRVIVVVFTIRDEKCRPITAFRAAPPYQAQYWMERSRES
jgi:uncharacterized DUF497 family protein